MGKVLAVSIEKGGSAKTITSTNLAVLAGNAGIKTLLVDLDKQGNSTLTMSGQRVIEFEGQGLYYAMKTFYAGNVAEYIIETEYENVSLLPACPEMDTDNMDDLLRRLEREKYCAPYEVLRETLKPIKDKYDLIILDCPTALSNMTKGAFAAADNVLIPLKIDEFSIEGAISAISLLDTMKERVNKDLNFLGIVFINVDLRTRAVPKIKNELMAAGYPVLNTFIRASQKVNDSTSYRMPAVVYAPDCSSTQDYRTLLEEIKDKIV